MYDLKRAICTTLFGTSYDGGWLQNVYMQILYRRELRTSQHVGAQKIPV